MQSKWYLIRFQREWLSNEISFERRNSIYNSYLICEYEYLLPLRSIVSALSRSLNVFTLIFAARSELGVRRVLFGDSSFWSCFGISIGEFVSNSLVDPLKLVCKWNYIFQINVTNLLLFPVPVDLLSTCVHNNPVDLQFEYCMEECGTLVGLHIKDFGQIHTPSGGNEYWK